MTLDDHEGENKGFIDFLVIRRWQCEIGGALWWVQVKHCTYLAAGRLAPSGD